MLFPLPFFYWERKLKNYLTILKDVISFYKDISVYISVKKDTMQIYICIVVGLTGSSRIVRLYSRLHKKIASAGLRQRYY